MTGILGNGFRNHMDRSVDRLSMIVSPGTVQADDHLCENAGDDLCTAVLRAAEFCLNLLQEWAQRVAFTDGEGYICRQGIPRKEICEVLAAYMEPIVDKALFGILAGAVIDDITRLHDQKIAFFAFCQNAVLFIKKVRVKAANCIVGEGSADAEITLGVGKVNSKQADIHSVTKIVRKCMQIVRNYIAKGSISQ